MNILLPLYILNETKKSVKDGKTTVNHSTSTLSILDDNGSVIVDKILKKYDTNNVSLFWDLNLSIKNLGFRPWVIILFEKEYKLAGHISSIRNNRRDVLFTSYSLADDYSIQTHGVPLMSIILIKDKSVLSYLTDKSELFKPAWEYLKDANEKFYWVFISKPPNESWYNKLKVDDNKLYLNKVNS